MKFHNDSLLSLSPKSQPQSRPQSGIAHTLGASKKLAIIKKYFAIFIL
jgi:hypothetical protein